MPRKPKPIADQLRQLIRKAEKKGTTRYQIAKITGVSNGALSRIMSGKPDGDWFYRLEATVSGAVVAGPVRVRVQHHPRRRAFAFFGLGAAVLVATLGLILVGIRANRI